MREAQPNHERDRRLLVGWREYVGFPDWGINTVAAKIDTGARTSALHVTSIEAVGADRVRFEVVLRRREPVRTVPVETAVIRMARVRPSSGRRQERYVVSTRVRIGPLERTIEVSLVCRARMLCRMLLGRTALGDDFLVDASRAHLLNPPRRRHGRDQGSKSAC